MPTPLHLVADVLGPMRAYRPKPARATKLDANETPDILSSQFREALARKVASAPLHRYPTAGSHEIKEALALRFGGSPAEYVVGCGSDEIICLLYLALRQPQGGERVPSVVFPDPSFVMYRQNAVTYGWVPHSVGLRDDWSLPVDRLVERANDVRANLVFVASPNNPTGGLVPQPDLALLASEAPRTLLVVDEAYAAFVDSPGERRESFADNLAFMGTLSKQGLAGIRLGWLRAKASLVEQIEKARQPFNVPLLTRMAAELALRDFWGDFQEAASVIRTERRRLEAGLRAIGGITVFPSQANFILIRVDEDLIRREQQLESAEIGLRSFPTEGRLENHFRITVGTSQETDTLLECLR